MFSFGLTGYPVSHSLSPKIQNAALKAAGLQGKYRLYPVDADSKELTDLLNRIRDGEIQGLNVTIPHKQAVVPYLDALTPEAAAIGAVNTIYMQSDRLIGHNTDAPGFLRDLYAQFPALDLSQLSKVQGQRIKTEARKSALVLGAGGSARAVVHALVEDGWAVTIAARREQQAKVLVDDRKSITENKSKIGIIRFSDLGSLNIDIIVNCTPLGMHPHIAASPWPAGLPFPKNAAVYDLVYNPEETKLARDARHAGLKAATGLGMLIEQAVLGFEIWTGVEAPREAMWAAVARD